MQISAWGSPYQNIKEVDVLVELQQSSLRGNAVVENMKLLGSLKPGPPKATATWVNATVLLDIGLVIACIISAEVSNDNKQTFFDVTVTTAHDCRCPLSNTLFTLFTIHYSRLITHYFLLFALCYELRSSRPPLP